MAWKPLGWRCAFMAEIAKFPRAVLAHHYPDVPLRGDFTEINRGDHEAIDVLVGGTPCQSFSIAGLRGGLADERGNLALEYLRLADRLRPRWLVWENVPGVRSSWSGDQPPSNLAEGQGWESVETSDFGCFIAGMVELGYGVAYRSLDAQYFGLAQRRERVFVVGHLGDWRRAAAVLFERASLRGDSPPSRKAGARPAIGTLGGTSPGGGWRFGADEAAAGQLVAADVAPPVTSNPYGDHESRKGLLVATTSGPGWWNETETAGALRSSTDGGALNATPVAFGGNNTRGPIDVDTAANAHGGPCGRMDFESETFIAHALRGTGFDASEDGTGRGTPIVSVAFDTTQITSPSNYSNPKPGDPCHPLASTQHPPAIADSAVRRLTPRECERLQGFPDDWTLIPWRGGIAPDGPRYMAIGNSMPVSVMGWIGRRIAKESA